MDQQKRLLLAIALSFGLTLVWTQFVWKPEADAEVAAQAAKAALLDGGVADAGTAAEGTPALPAAGTGGTDGADGGVAAEAPAVAPPPPVRRLEAPRATTAMSFTSQGAGLTGATLLGERERQLRSLSIPEGYRKLFGAKFDAGPQVDMAVPVPGAGPVLDVSVTGRAPFWTRERFEVTEEAPGRLVFTARKAPWKMVKTYTFDPAAKGNATGYQLRLEVALTNESPEKQDGDLVLHLERAIDPAREEAPSMFGGIGNQAMVLCRHGDDVKRVPPKENEPRHEESGAIGFVALDQGYFLAAAWPLSGAVEGRCSIDASPAARAVDLLAPVAVDPGATVTKQFGVFLGPKDLDLLASVGEGAAWNPRLDTTVDFGWWAAICRVLIFLLRLFHGLAGNWGLAVILLTVLVKVLLLPLTHKAMVSAEAMKKLQPRMEDIKKRFPEDKERQNLEMMKLYQEAKVNPLGGCLPLLLQLPIWAALFTTLRTSYELYGEPFWGVWSDLTSKDPTYLLPVALGITMVVTQRLQPQVSMDPSQQVLMTWVMPIFFTALMMNYPAGLSLYIFTNNLLSIAQQYALRKWLARHETAPAGGKA